MLLELNLMLSWELRYVKCFDFTRELLQSCSMHILALLEASRSCPLEQKSRLIIYHSATTSRNRNQQKLSQKSGRSRSYYFLNIMLPEAQGRDIGKPEAHEPTKRADQEWRKS